MQVNLLRAAFPLLLIVQFLASESSGQQASRGVPRDDAQAVASPRKVDDAYTQAALEMMKAADPNTKTYDMGRPCVVVGCPVTTEESQKIASMRKAADEGDPYAQTYIGVVYASGRGVPKNDAQAVGWYRKAADQGYGDAQTYLGIMYQTGRGVPRDDAQAAAWIRKAADQGDSYAQTTLGIMYETGRGVPKNNAQAVVWYRKAAAQNDELAKMKLVDPAKWNLAKWNLLRKGMSKEEARALLGEPQGIVKNSVVKNSVVEKWFYGTSGADHLPDLFGPSVTFNVEEKLESWIAPK